MAINQVNSYSVSNTNILNLQDTVDDQRIGYHQVSLTELDSETVPQIAAGSKFENNGALWEVTTNTSIGGTPTEGINYIEFDPSTPAFTWSSTLGTWSDSKQGFYNSNNRYLLWDVLYQTSYGP